jgi:hypothetical protein
MTQNKKIQYGVAAAMLLSMFLPFFDLTIPLLGSYSPSIFDGLTDSTLSFSDSYIYTLLIAGFAISTYLEKSIIARICSGLLLLCCLYTFYNVGETFSGTEIGITDFFGIGAYLLMASSVAGIIYSKKME